MQLYNEENILLNLTEELKGIKIIILDEIPSTNDYAKELVRDNRGNESVLILAREQSAGKGQYGRRFYSPKDCGIYMSLIVHPEISGEELPYVTVMCGACVRDALKEVCGLDCKLKYINDVLCNGKKLCGILTEVVFEGSECKAVIIGIGLNVKPWDYPTELSDLVTSVEENIENNANPNILISKIAYNVINSLKTFNITDVKTTYLNYAVDLPEDNLIE